MNVTKLLNSVGMLIGDTDTSQPGPYGVFITNHQLNTKPVRDREPEDRLLIVYHRHYVNSGFSSKEWNKIEGELRKDILGGYL